jgi:hypothetical protein
MWRVNYAKRWPRGLMGGNRPAGAMPFDGIVRRYFDDIYIVNLFTNKQMLATQINRLCARCCTQHLAHNGKYCQLFPLARTPTRQHIGMCSRDGFNMIGLIRAIAGQKMHLQFRYENPLSLTSPVSWVDFLKTDRGGNELLFLTQIINAQKEKMCSFWLW